MSTVTTNSISPPISAQYIRINPQTWKNHICMRVELYGCPGKQYMNYVRTVRKYVRTVRKYERTVRNYVRTVMH